MDKKNIFEVEKNSIDDKINKASDELNQLKKDEKITTTEFTGLDKAANLGGVGLSPEARKEDKDSKKKLALSKRKNLLVIKEKQKLKKAEIDILKKEKTGEGQEEVNKPETGNKENVKEAMAKLTKNDILRMVENEEPARITKRELVESITRTLLKEGMNDDLRRKIERGETDYSEHLDPETIRSMSDDIIDNVARNFEAKTGRRVNLDNASRTLSQSLMSTLQIEASNKRELERLAVKLVSEEYGVPEGSVDFKAEITGHPQLGGRSIQKTGLKMEKGTKSVPEGKTTEELKPNVTKRRFINAMIHGAARKGQNLFHLASNELNRINPSLVQEYGKIMASNDFLYWALDDESIKREGQSGTHAGQVRVYPHGKPPAAGKKPLIEAEGMTFPFLLHELTKGVIELITQWGRESDKSIRDYVEDKTDNLESETMDIRLGAKIWEKFLDILDIDHLAYKAEILQRMSQLPATEFSALINGLMKDDPDAIESMKEIVFSIIREKNEQAVEQAFKKYRDEDEEKGDTKEKTEDDDEDPILKGLISKKEENVDNPETWTKRRLEDERDEALDNGDYKAVAYLQSILDKKFG